jgi:hypothetical protein
MRTTDHPRTARVETPPSRLANNAPRKATHVTAIKP